MKKQKLTLNKLKIKSFITNLHDNGSDTIKGGTDASNGCETDMCPSQNCTNEGCSTGCDPRDTPVNTADGCHSHTIVDNCTVTFTGCMDV